MLRIGSARSLLRAPLRAAPTPKRLISSVPRPLVVTSNRNVVALCEAPKVVSVRLPIATQKLSFATKPPSAFQQGIDPKEDKKIAQRKLTPHPESVTTESSVCHLYEPEAPDKERPLSEGVTDDLKIVRETFSLSNAPKEPYWLGLAGTLPYLGTSVSTVYLAWVLNTEWPTSSTLANNLLISSETASRLLATLEPVQLGYGAVIISFLGAVHWGLEYAEKVPNPSRTKFRYGIGVMAPIVAWPTLFLPVEFALTSQFAAFVALYFADARASVRGWAPVWYSTYRFALTAVVGVAIAISLIGRAKVGDASPRLTGLSDKFHERHGEEEYTKKWQDLEKEEVQKVKKQKEAEKRKEREQKETKAEGREKPAEDGPKEQKHDEGKDDKN
ncbi:putative mitochondrial inner membrane protein 1 protein [Rosellinia necatrix]|uniref:Putative mitochondrial inner membrane protein 1 protein n=1 Tax=Rosellinia necatrix TaxID=77044 RepID=A0A1W2TUJ2_ROSNE|nr:putative mitochondrial inner membrane protein 1 protein [Rosellinia necatrix]